MSDYITVEEFTTTYLSARIEMEAKNNLRKWCKLWGVSYQYVWNIRHGYSKSVSSDFLQKIGCRYKVEIP